VKGNIAPDAVPPRFPAVIARVQPAFDMTNGQREVRVMARAKSVAKAKGVALSRELAELVYDVDYYVHIDTPQDAVKLVTHMPSTAC
jgi:hypothetical protein